MKFVLKKGAPDIPLEILEARDDDQLVLFCGAGISLNAGLMNFKDLVNHVYEALGDEMTDEEDKAYKKGLYDRVFELLERRYFLKDRADKYLVREKIIDSLSITPEADLSTHKAILELSKTQNGKIRLVTTNVDHGFLLAEPALKNCIDSAPKLPIPKPYKWYSLVHLHGIIDDNDSDGKNLVFTSGDFGTAYLTERWASRFVSELFRNFQVLFVGYSIEDPVMRYMTDAIAAELRRGDKQFFQPFAFVATHPAKRKKDQKAWEAKGVRPILYNARKKHTYLHNTLKRWAEDCRDGLRAKMRIISMNAPFKPQPPYNDDQTKLVIDTLMESSDQHSDSITGVPARAFSELDPPPPIEWLPALDKSGVLNLCSMPQKCYAVSLKTKSNLVEPNKISWWLWQWLTKHLEKELLIHWVIDHGLCLHPYLANLINEVLHGETPPDAPYYNFWKIIVSGQAKCDLDRYYDIQQLLNNLKDRPSPLDLQIFLETIEPRVKFSKPFPLMPGEPGSPPPYEAEIVLGIGDDYLLQEIESMDVYPKVFIPVLFEISLLLKKAMKLFEEFNLASSRYDRSYIDMPSIAPHNQNYRFNNWVFLIQLCRDVWHEAWEQDRSIAQTAIELWKSIDFPVFRRLLLHAFTVEEVLSPSQALNYLLQDSGWWLWASETKREKYRLLNKIWPFLDEHDAEKLIEAIISGPPRTMYHSDLSSQEWQHIVDFRVWKLLKKLTTFGRPLPSTGQKILQELSEKYSDLEVNVDESDEFSFWMGEPSRGPETDISIVDMLNLETPELVKKLSERTSRFYEGRISTFRAFCKEYPEKALEILIWLHSNHNWNCGIWEAALRGLAEVDNPHFLKVASLLLGAPPKFFTEAAWAVAWWIRKTTENIEPDTNEEEKFFRLFDMVLQYTPIAHFPETDDAVTRAINEPVGMMAEALIYRFFHRKIEAYAGIPNGVLKRSLQILIDGKRTDLVLARLIIASHMHYFFSIDPDWVRTNLLPRMSWNESSEAKYLWQGYLRNPKISADLLRELKQSLLETTQHVRELPNRKKVLFHLVAWIMLQRPDFFSVKEQRQVLKDIASEGRAEIAKFFLLNLRKRQGEKNDSFWNNRIRPILEKAWPKDAESINGKTSEFLVLIAIETGERFPEAVKIIKTIIGPLHNLNLIVMELNHSKLPQKYPLDVLHLLGMVFTESYEFPRRNFRELLEKIVKSDPQLSNNPIYRRIDKYLQLHRL